MRVLHVSAYFAPAFCYGGPPRSILGLCQSLRRHGVEAEVLTTTANGADELPGGRRDYEGVPAEYVPRSFPKRFFNADLRRRLEALLPSFDLLHVHGLWNLTVWKACAAARRGGKPYLTSPRGMLDPGSMRRQAMLKRVMSPLVERRNLRRAAVLHATSQAEAGAIERFHLSPPIRTIPNGVDFVDPDQVAGRELRRQRGIGEREPVAAYLGRIAPNKRLDLLADAFAAVRRTIPGATLLVAGPDEKGYLEALRPRFAPLSDIVHFLGEVNDAGKRALFAAANVLVCCSDSESFGLSVAEALGAGVPAVVTKTCPWESVERVKAGRWVEHSASAIAAGLNDVLSDLGAARSMGENGRRFVRHEYAWDNIAKKMVALYQEALAGRSP